MGKLKQKFATPLLQLYDINKNFVCNLTNRTLRNSAYSIKKKTPTNDVKTLTFSIPFDNEYIHANSCEYLIKFEFDWYIIKTVTLSSEDVTVLEVYCEDEFTISKTVLCEPLELIGCSPKEMFDSIMGATGDVILDYKFKGTDIASYRSIITESEASCFENLIKMAEAFSAVIEMSTDRYGQKWIFLRKNPYDRGKVIRKDFDVTSLTIEYNTSEIFTRLMPFGEPDDYGIDLNIGDVNPTGKLYIENYSYYEEMGMTSEEIANNPQCKAMTVRTYDNITDPAELLSIATEDLKTLCKPSVSGSLSFRDLSVLEDSSMIEPLVYEKLIVVDAKTKMRFESIIQEIEYNYDNPLESNIVLNNTITYNSIFKDLVTAGEKIDKVTTTNPTTGETTIIAGVIQGKIDTAVTQIGTMLDTIESPESVYAILFEDRRVGSPLYGSLAIGTNGILIAHELNPDNTWNWATAINSLGINASEVVTGTLWADVIKAGTLSDINNTSWFNLEDGTFSYGNGAITFDGEALDITIGGKSIEEIVSSTILTVIPNRESCIITLDEDLTPSKDTEYTFEFKVYKNNSTEEVPCVIKDVISSSQNVTTEWTNTANTVKLKAGTDTVFTDTEGSLEVTVETTIGDIKKVVYWNTIINTIEASILILSASSQMFVKPDIYSDFEPDSIDITAQCIRCEISSWKYSINNGKTFNLIESGTNDITISPNKLNIKNTSNLFDENNNIIIRAESDSGVSDNMTISRIEDTDTFNVQLSNENHTFIADSNGMAYAQKIAIDVYAFKGTENVSTTVGLIENIPNGMTITIDNNNSLNPSINIEVDESFDTVSGTISIPVTVSGAVIKKTFSYSLVKEGASGESASYVWALPTTLFFKEKSGVTTPEEIKITMELSNCTFKNWSYSIDGEIWNTITTSSTGLTIDVDYTLIITPSFGGFNNSDTISFKITADSPTNVSCYDVITITKLKDGVDAFTVVLDNESHTFIGNYEGYAINSSINISPMGYVGVNRVPISIGTITGKPTGMTTTITNNNTASPIIRITVNTTMTRRNGTVTIPITATYNNIAYSVNKIFSYSLSLDGTPASNVKIVGASNTFLSGDGGKTYTPSSLTFTGTYTECNYSKWQYLDTIEDTWKDVLSGALGLTITTNNGLEVLNTSQLFSTNSGSVTFRLMTDVTGIYDMITVNKLTQVDNIGEELDNIKSSITQTNNKWTAEFTLSNTSNILFDGDFNLSTINYWNELNSDTSISLGTVNAYPFYENHQSLLTTFKYSNETGINYSLDLSLEPNTDYVYQAYIYTDNSNLDTSDSLPLTYWTWVGDTPTSSETLDTSEIIDYSQIIEVGRYNLCYIHFKTKDLNSFIKCRLFIKGKTNRNDGSNANLSIRQICFRQRSMPGRFEPNANEVKAGVTTIDMNGITVEHTLMSTKTEMSADGFRIVDTEGENEVISEWSSKNFWSQFTVHEVFATNIENVYTGTESIFVLHSYTGVEMDGSSEKPFKSFADLQKALEKTPIINKDIKISVMTKDNCTETFALSNLRGSGKISILFSTGFIGRGGGTREAGIKLTNIQLPVTISGAGLFDQFIHGALFYNCMFVEIKDCIFNVPNYGCLFSNTNGLVNVVDFASSYCAIGAEKGSVVSVISASGNAGTSGTGECCRVMTGAIVTLGKGSQGATNIPTGTKSNQGGYINIAGTCNASGSWNYPTSKPIPTAPTTMSYTQGFNWTARGTYAYSWGSWSNNDCKQGAWGAGLRGGHLFFDMTAIRNFLSGTIQDGNTITLTRASNGGISGGANVYINGSSCSGTSGTPSYGNQTLLGTLAWGETKTFTLPKAIVQGLKNGSYNSLAVYVNSSAQNCYLNIVNASITLKTVR